MAGIVDAINIASAFGGGDVDFSVGDLSSGSYRVSSFKWTPRISSSPLPMLNRPSNWPTHFDPRELVIDLEGRLVADNPSDFWTDRAALLEAIVPPVDGERETFEHGTLTITLPGYTAGDLYALVNLTEYDFPVTSQSGRSAEYRFSWVASLGYWRLVSDDTLVII